VAMLHSLGYFILF